MNDLCVMPYCFSTTETALCEKHQAELRQRRLRAEVLELVAARPQGYRAIPARDPREVKDADYLPAPLRRPGAPGWRPAIADTVEQVVVEPTLRAVLCPEDKVPSGVKQAVKHAVNHGWVYQVDYAIGPSPDEIRSVRFRAHQDQVLLESIHEKKETDKAFGFKRGWYQRGNSLPLAVGWRELVANLQGADFLDQQTAELRRATMLCMDLGMDFVEMI